MMQANEHAPSALYDVVVIGGGIVGCAVLWELAKYDLKLLLLERGPDVATGISKANSGILHTGFDAPPGTLEAALVTAASHRFPDVCKLLDVPIRRCGAIMVALNEEDLQACEEVLEQARANGVHDVQRLSRAQLLEMEPNVNPCAVGGLLIPRESVSCSARLTIAYAESAVLNGAEVGLNEPVLGLAPTPDGLLLQTPRRQVQTRFAVNAAGLYADDVARLVGDESFRITPRKGEFFVLDRHASGIVSHIVLPVPTPTTKGILVAPTVDGNLIVGPTADDIQDKADVATTADGLRRVAEGARRLVPSLRPEQYAIAQYAGLRSVCSTGRFEIRPSCACPRLIHAAGIRSTGLSASPEIARTVRELLAAAGLSLKERPGYRPERPGIQRVRDADPEQLERLYSLDSRYAHLVCRCEHISEAELVRAIHSPIPARTLDALKRRVRVGTGRCQGGFCTPRVLEILARELGLPPDSICKDAPGSELLVGPNKWRWMQAHED
jgi:glycerol-3-phosphate dehydrogenase